MKYALTGAALLGLLAVILGAFGQHALAHRIAAPDYAAWDIAARYHFYHALAMGLAGLLAHGGSRAWSLRAAVLFALGILLFSGSLYLFAITHSPVVAFMPPLGGLCFILGWLALAVAGWKSAA